ncbi:TPM domain-containing protein [Usitatibacter palustris]|uniref:TPM domain-containing protein n=1 Tax=Usitatibacter palustris TaxID=2732487 RepID=UPI00148A0023|nr:TPM domain-containing protein [Usitatibacter palustris]
MQFLKRFLRHMAMTPYKSKLCFPDKTMAEIQRVVAECEAKHRGEVRFVVEAELSTAQLWANMTSRQRAIEVFSSLQVWNTEENSGILIYLLLADHKVEIVADRGINAKVADDAWRSICSAMEQEYRAGRFESGAIAGVKAASELLVAHFPARETNANELPDAPVRM